MTCLILNFGIGIPGAFWRAVFVAALALIAFTLTRYWKSLSGNSQTTRYVLVGLRGLSLVLVACAFAGVQIVYQKQMSTRILINRAFARPAGNGSKVVDGNEAVRKVATLLKGKDFELIEQTDIDSANGSYPLATIVVTDGAMRSADASSEVERAQTATGGGPVFVVSDFEPSPGPRVVIESIAIMNRPMRGVPLLVRCLAHARGMRGRGTLVTISDDAQVRGSAKALWTGDDERQAVTLEVVPKTAGWVNYSVRSEDVGDEASSLHWRPLTSFIEDRRQRILFLESEPTWEAKFIRRALDKSELFDVDYFAQISRASVVGVNAGQAGAGSNAVSTKEPSSPELGMRAALSSASRLNTYDCIFIGATLDTLLSNAEATRLREWVERRGGGLIILGGNSFAGSIVAPKGKLGSLMPAETDSSSFRSGSQAVARNTPIEAGKSRVGIVLTPTVAGESGALRAFANALEGNKRADVLSGEGFRLGTLRPGSTVLSVRGQPGGQGTTEDGEPLIVSMRYGAGRSIVFAPADSWRMRTSESGDQVENDSPFAALWQGMALWAASTARPSVEVVSSDESPATGSETTVEIHVRDEGYAPLRIEKLSGRIHEIFESNDESASNASSRDISFFPDPNDTSIWRARFIAPKPGRFDLRVNYTANGKSGTADKYFATVASSTIEPGTSRDTLSRVARASGGDYFEASDLNSLSEKLAALPQTKKSLPRTLELRSWWPLALIIPFLLSCEWLLGTMRRTTSGEV